MTQLLQRAFDQASALPPKVQDAFGALFISEMESEQTWDDLFTRSQDLLEKMADEAIKDFHQGRTTELGWDEL